MIFIGRISRLARENNREHGESRHISEARKRSQGYIYLTDVIPEGDEVAAPILINTSVPFEMKSRVLPHNLQKHRTVRLRGSLDRLTSKTNIIVVDDVVVESPSSLQRAYKETGVDVATLKRTIAASSGYLGLYEAERNGGRDLIKDFLTYYTQDAAMLHDILTRANARYDLDAAFSAVKFFEARAQRRKYDSVSDMVLDNPWVLSELEGFSLGVLSKIAPAINPAVSQQVMIYARVASKVWSVIWQGGHSYATLDELAIFLRSALSAHGVPFHGRKKYIAGLATINKDELPHKAQGQLVAYSQFDQETTAYYRDVYEGMDNADYKARSAGKGVYLARVYFAERDVAAGFAKLIGRHDLDVDTSRLDDFDLDPGQRQAILNALTHRVSVVNGPAGTGKTWILRALATLLTEVGCKMIVLAQSAMAASVAAKAAGGGIPSGTIHRVMRIPQEEEDLGDLGEAVDQDDMVIVQQDLVAVDEMVMCDICAFSHLIHALRDGASTHLVLLGDVAQLPAIGPSGFYHQLVRRGPEIGVPVVTLSEQHRQTGEIVVLGEQVRNGVFPDPLEIESLRNVKTGRLGDIVPLAREMNNAGYEPGRNLLILSPRRSDLYGTSQLNAILRPIFNPDGAGLSDTHFHIGDPVVSVRNDYAQFHLGDEVITGRGDFPEAAPGSLRTDRHPGRRMDIPAGSTGKVTGWEGETVWVRMRIEGAETDVPYTLFELNLWLADPGQKGQNRKKAFRHRLPGRLVDVYNGMRGRIEKRDGELVQVRYKSVDGAEVLIPYAVRELSYYVEPAYAMTVHKAQGAEADCVILVNPEKHKISRNLLYTAVTRARKSLYLLGGGWIDAVQQPQEEPRSKFLFRVQSVLKNMTDDKTHLLDTDDENGEILFG